MKPRVEYVDIAAAPEVGHSACLFTIDHPYVTGWICTSVVVKITGLEIETRNTIYHPAQTDESNPYTQEKQLVYQKV